MTGKEITEPVKNTQMQPSVHAHRHNVAKEALIGAGIGAAGFAIFAPVNAASPSGSWGGILAFDVATMNIPGALLSAFFLVTDRDKPNRTLEKGEARSLAFKGALTGAVVGAVFGAGQAMWRNHKEKPPQSHVDKMQQSVQQANGVSR